MIVLKNGVCLFAENIASYVKIVVLQIEAAFISITCRLFVIFCRKSFQI